MNQSENLTSTTEYDVFVFFARLSYTFICELVCLTVTVLPKALTMMMVCFMMHINI